MVETNPEFRELLVFYREIGAAFLSGNRENKVTEPGPENSLEAIETEISRCTSCRLHKSRHCTVAGRGAVHPEIMFVGEAPGEQEDQTGIPFVGAAGKLLDSLIKSMGYSRETVFIGNIIKCRPPGNRAPLEDEIKLCLPFLFRQIELLKPKVLICLGRVAMNALLGQRLSITRVRGKLFHFKDIPLIPTFHPSYILHQRSREEISRAKWEVWEDMQKVTELIKGS